MVKVSVYCTTNAGTDDELVESLTSNAICETDKDQALTELEEYCEDTDGGTPSDAPDDEKIVYQVFSC